MSDILKKKEATTYMVKYKGIACHITFYKNDDNTLTGRVVLAVAPEPYIHQEPFKSEELLRRHLINHAISAWLIKSKRDSIKNKDKPKLDLI